MYFFSTEKKTCWIHDSKSAYVEAEVKGRGGDGRAIVETTDGKVKELFFFKAQEWLGSQFNQVINIFSNSLIKNLG